MTKTIFGHLDDGNHGHNVLYGGEGVMQSVGNGGTVTHSECVVGGLHDAATNLHTAVGVGADSVS